MYMKLYGYFAPMLEPQDDFLQELAQYQVFFTLFIALLIRTGTVQCARLLFLSSFFQFTFRMIHADNATTAHCVDYVPHSHRCTSGTNMGYHIGCDPGVCQRVHLLDSSVPRPERPSVRRKEDALVVP
jgi:hypothetical protein